MADGEGVADKGVADEGVADGVTLGVPEPDRLGDMLADEVAAELDCLVLDKVLLVGLARLELVEALVEEADEMIVEEEEDREELLEEVALEDRREEDEDEDPGLHFPNPA